MAICPKCGLPFSITEGHICEGRDATKLWLLVTAAIGGLAGAIVGGLIGRAYVDSLIRQACEGPSATNLCGLTSAPALPFYVVIGAIIGAGVAACAVVGFFRMRKS